MAEQFVIYATEDDDHLGVQRDDMLVVTPGGDPAVTLTRALPPNYGAILGAIEAGRLTPADGSPSVELLRRAVGDDDAGRPPRGRRRGSLALVP